MSIRNCSEIGYNLQLIVKRLFANQNLLKYLYYTEDDPLSQPDLTDEQIRNEIYEKLIKIIPFVQSTETAQSIIAIRVTSGVPNFENNEFRNVTIGIEVFVPFSSWFVKSDNLRPFLILGEIEKSLKGKTINGLGRIESEGFTLNFLTEEIANYEATYSIITYE